MLEKLKEMLKSLESMEGSLDDAFYSLPVKREIELNV